MSANMLSLAEKVARHKFRYMRNYDVFVTKVFFPSTFYVRLVSISQNDLYSLEVLGRPLKKEDLKINKMVVYHSETMGKFVRGKICKIVPQEGDPKYLIHAIDYGFYDHSVLFEKISEPGGDPSIEPLAMLCQIANCYPVGGSPWEQGASDAMRNLIGESVVRMHVRAALDQRLIVDINIKATMVDVGQWLITNRFALSHYPDENEVPHPMSSYKEVTFRKLEDGDTLHVRVQAATSVDDFYTAKLEDYVEYLAEREEFTRYCEEQEDLLPTEVYQGRAVGYKCPYEETFYERACILHVKSNGNRAVIQLVDWGDKIEVKHNELKKLDFMKIRGKPAIAIYCSTDESAEWQFHLNDYLCPGFEFIITVKNAGDEYSIPHIVDVTHTP